MIKLISTYIPPLKNAFFRCSLAAALSFFCFSSASAQFSLMFGGVYQGYTGAPKGYPFIIGINPRVAMDIGQRSQVSLQTTLAYPATWEYKNNLRLEGLVVSTYVPVPVGGKAGLGVVEFSALYSYYLLGKNFTKGGLYVSGGPGAAFYVSKLSGISSKENFLNQHTDYLLDMRLGGQYAVPIGWIYLESRLAPTIASTGLTEGEEKPGSLYGINLGMRFLLNRHPYCAE